MANGAPMSDEDMRKELENIQLKINATTDEVNYTVSSQKRSTFVDLAITSLYMNQLDNFWQMCYGVNTAIRTCFIFTPHLISVAQEKGS